mmetsp:Transcript_19942/g.51852  ORF Transcript_19942/g.51852 Transcript_19942/m.51852 type:complete len:1521 (-) Transcript_19942:995-5557(-)
MKALRGQTVVQKGALAPNGFLVPRGQVRSSARGVASPSLIGERSLGIRAALPIVRQQAGLHWSSKKRHSVVVAVSAPEQQDTKFAVDETFSLPKGNETVRATVEQKADGAQTVRLTTSLQAGRLLLHWGVEGGKDYQGGWRLPSTCRPPGTKQYKDRALQSPFQVDDQGSHLFIMLSAEEASDVLNFVLKDEATNTWYDNSGSNFRLPLHGEASGKPSTGTQVIPKALADKWAWMRWDHQGRPQQSMPDANKDYDRGVEEMRALMGVGRSMDELWRVAEGKWPYPKYLDEVEHPAFGDKYDAFKVREEQAAASGVSLGPIPVELLSVQAYICWEKAGQPQGADFADEARRVIEDRVRGGATYEQLAKEMNLEPTWKKDEGKPQPEQQAPQQHEAKQAPPAAPSEVGKPLGAPKRNPLDLVKPQGQAPVLSEGKSQKREMPLDFLEARWAIDPSTKWRRKYGLGNKSEMLVVVRQKEETDPIRVDFITDRADKLILHWGVSKPGSRSWKLPPAEMRDEDSKEATELALESPFLECDDEDECDLEFMGAKVPLQRRTITLPADSWVGAISCVLRSADATMWYKDGGGDFLIPVPCKHVKEGTQLDAMPQLTDDLSREIVDAENSGAWTLMHRFNKATDLINNVANGQYDLDPADGFARIYAWLRYSATRKLTWQRNYNTQPRQLSGSQDRLTGTIASTHARTTGEPQEWVRMMLTTVGRGGDGQKIRDEILNIMHRNNIPEKKGLWIEDWHQKLHNNTTPDDVPICEAYLAYLEQNGSTGAYWRVLADAGVTRERLESFDRPVRGEPQWFDGKKDALIRDFRNYLGILKSVHSGADLQAAASAAGNQVPDGVRGYLAYVMGHVGDSQTLPLMEAAVEARTELAPALPGNRELLYLDLALEDQARQAAERGVGAAGFGAAAFMRPLLQNLALSLGNNEEVCYCLKAWQELPKSVRHGGRPTKDEALLAVAVVNRIRRAISEVSDNVVKRIGDVGKAYGQAFGVEAWASELFAEEVVRGGPAFAVSLNISGIEPTLRNAAELGAWQVISPQEVVGVVEYVDGLHDVQEKTYEKPTVLVASQVSGEEEIPEGVVAVLTPDAPDVLSHVSVRARNMRVLFATCHDPEPLEQIKAAAGTTLHFTTTASGAVHWNEAHASEVEAASDSKAADKPSKGLKISIPKWPGKWVVGMDEYKDGVVGAKSKNIAGLRGKMPDWISLPASVTLPFGSYEQALEAKENADIKAQIQSRVARINARQPNSNNGGAPAGEQQEQGGDEASTLLAECRELAMQVHVPPEVKQQLTEAMTAAGIPVPDSEERWAKAMEAIKGVWASKYNDRAYISLRKIGLSFDDVRMAVLVQRVVPAHYAFVIHTRNPSNNDPNEIFCELVRGLGESLVSGMVAGSAVAFKANKKDLDSPEVLCYASKSEGMFVGESLIFRSDSNGEDLEGYAGAGLYESITMDATKTLPVDYLEDKLVTDVDYRQQLLARICKVGAAIEDTLGSAQDVEGVVEEDGSITVVQTRPQV